MESTNESRKRAVLLIDKGSSSATAAAIVYLGDRISEGVIDRETTDALDSIRVEVGGMAQAMTDLAAEVAHLPRGRRQA